MIQLIDAKPRTGGLLLAASGVGRNGGTAVTLGVPRSPPMVAAQPKSSPAVSGDKSKGSPSSTVLVADRDPKNLETIASTLSAAGYDVLRATDGDECVRIASAELPDIILMGIEPEDGTAAATFLGKHEKARNIPVVMVTGPLDAAGRKKALKAGAVDFLFQPVSSVDLLAKVASLVRLKAYRDEAQSQREGLIAEVAGKTGQLEAALEAFSRFVPREFLTCLSKASILEVSLGDQVQADMSILFADIRSFTAMSEKMTPRENFSFLNSYLGRMNPFIWENGGYIDKYVGDEIMALFPSGPGAALDAAIAMLKHMPVYNTHRAGFGYEPVKIGIGVHAGTVMLGIIGHERFMQGTVISDAVNLAARLEELTKIYGVELIVSNHVLFGLENPNRYHYRFLDNVLLKGKSESVPVYEVFDSNPPALLERKTETREAFEHAVMEYHAGRYASAAKLFDSIPRGETRDGPVEIYRARSVSALAAGAQKAPGANGKAAATRTA